MKVLFGVPVKIHREIAIAEVEAYKQMGIEIETADFGNSGQVKGRLKSAFLVFKNAFTLKWKLTRFIPDYVYLNSSFDEKTIVRDAITLFILRLFAKKIKVLIKIHGRNKQIVLKKDGFIAKLKWYLFENIDLFLVLSTEEKNDFLQMGVRADNLMITANSINKNLYSRDDEFRQSLDPDGDTILVLFVGRLIKEKGILDLVEACKIVKEKGLKFKLFCLGDGPERSKISGLLSAYNLIDSVFLVGYIPEAATKAYYSNCDMLVLPSYSEGFPMAVFQAVAAGKPVITTKICGAADHLHEGTNCLWVKIGCTQHIAFQIMRLSKDGDLRKLMQQNNLLLAESFTKQKIAGPVVAYLKTLLQRKGANQKQL